MDSCPILQAAGTTFPKHHFCHRLYLAGWDFCLQMDVAAARDPLFDTCCSYCSLEMARRLLRNTRGRAVQMTASCNMQSVYRVSVSSRPMNMCMLFASRMLQVLLEIWPTPHSAIFHLPFLHRRLLTRLSCVRKRRCHPRKTLQHRTLWHLREEINSGECHCIVAEMSTMSARVRCQNVTHSLSR